MKHTPTPDFLCRHVKFGMQLDRSHAHTKVWNIIRYSTVTNMATVQNLTSRATNLAYIVMKFYSSMCVQLQTYVIGKISCPDTSNISGTNGNKMGCFLFKRT